VRFNPRFAVARGKIHALTSLSMVVAQVGPENAGFKRWINVPSFNLINEQGISAAWLRKSQ
jgi:hypothetical protein